jgi:hypothetical protein
MLPQEHLRLGVPGSTPSYGPNRGHLPLKPALSFLELYLRNISSRLRHTSGMNETSLQFHIEANDYFGTLATVLDLVSQDLRKKGHPANAEMLDRLRDDLAYLQRSHRIESADNIRNMRPVNLQ